MKVLITGGSGLIGSALTKKLIDLNIEVVHLTRTRNSKAGVKTYEWDWKKGIIDSNTLNGVTDIIHLAGAGIAEKPWTMKRKRILVKSRVLTARMLRTKIENENLKINSFISASGIGFYGAKTTNEILTEESNRGDDFISECCVQWEDEVSKLEKKCRVVKLRTGIVLSRYGGVIEKMQHSINRGMGAPLASGKQYMPWVHLDDIVQMYIFALTNNSVNGTFNAVASEHITNSEFTISLAKSMKKKIRIKRIPAWLIKFLFSEMSEILLNGSRISNKKILSTGFKFKYNSLKNAMKDSV